jgi:16S rRNA U516 pseudouridylate synthase RsuA-like enzyme
VFAALGYKVKRLERTKIGDLSDATLKPGASRMLKRAEVEKLRGERRETGIWKLESRKLRR